MYPIILWYLEFASLGITTMSSIERERIEVLFLDHEAPAILNNREF